MTLNELIVFLENCDQRRIVPMGFSKPHSYRGYYDNLAFEPTESITIGEMLAEAKSALNETFVGWKGGEYIMDGNADVWLAEEGCCGERIGEILLNYMVGNYD